MRKLMLKLVLIQTIFMVGCTQKTDEIIEIKSGDIITMQNLDDYMFRDDIQYVDLRNFESRFLNGFIYSFEVIPFFDYLDYRAFDRDDTYTFEPSQIKNVNEIERLFDKDKIIFLYADGCIRAGYIKDLLSYLEYDRVVVLGGYYEYDGIYNVLGNGRYSFGDTFYNSFIDENTGDTYYIYGRFNLSKQIIEIRFDIIDEDSTSFRTENYDLNIDYNTLLTNLEEYIVYDLITLPDLGYALSNLNTSEYDIYLDDDSDITMNILNLLSDFIPE